ncbi:aldo/keto reductase [Pseudomonas sp. NEEL19]|uniref:aldo/keto reductase n=1 Tax=Pseudomonas sp. NEEL19 TaxID=2867409 RepID=UPI00236840D9|nr:aldo/keto reductase [Pseudomonas sp. NEEL19]WDM61570.1 aldo/keto reductase [Pseudomonas sp. NEEL19]
MYARRDVLRVGATLGLLASAPWLHAATPAGMLTRAVPSSGEALPVIGAGTSGSFEVEAGSAAYQQLRAVLKAFFDGDGRVIDTSPNYGGADSILGQLLEEGGWHSRCFIATKIAADSRAEAQAQWAESLKRLRTDKVDLLQVHNLRDWRTQLPYARELKQQGKTRYVGITHYLNSGHAEVAELVRSEALDFIQINYSVSAPQAARELLPLCQERGVAVLINRAFDDGRLFTRVKDQPLPGWAAEAGIGSWAQLFLKFAISHPAVTTVIPATGRPDRQLDQLMAGQGPLLTQAQQQALIRHFT